MAMMQVGSGDREHRPALRELLVSREARRRYRFDETLFAQSGALVFGDFRAAREVAHRLNEAREAEHSISAGQLNAAGLLHELLHAVVAHYRDHVDAQVMVAALARLEERVGGEAVAEVLHSFVDQFPALAVHRGEVTIAAYLEGESEGASHRTLALEELLLLWLTNVNPACAPLRELFDDSRLARRTAYPACIEALEEFFSERPGHAAGGPSLLDLLRAPMLASPDSIEGQLGYVRRFWGDLLGAQVQRVLGGLDLLAEESKMFLDLGPGPAMAPDYAALDPEYEAFSPDLDWMPRVVLIAKNVHVWLDQLSRQYEAPITCLDEVPDEELDRLARWGMTGLWLIGVWQRSRASARIKKTMGDDDAVASAYSLDDYRVADDLGGEVTFDDLRRRAWERGIRLSTDMVPNHVGIDSRWVVEHPEWFIALDHSPFPGYTFSGPDLCDDDRVGIYLEDRYRDRSDAAVVFKRVDHWTGDERYIYHGNDGTAMPWNDTAQLDYLNPEVREAVIQTILHVARRSPIIRFDAAMTLAKRHYHRLWFPEPGTGGDIPSRADFGMSRRELDEAMPTEFWRDVVDRVAREAPDTLLLAEAFWLLEGYFVRTLGMHRVYNSAFMNMLRDERNADYRQLIKSTLEFDPQILKRYVNFMSNPDERTAVDQFGTDGKYFGVATLLATMPGLPMFGHGQIEGYAEKYGMEFRRPRRRETPDAELIARHERQVFPLLRRRWLFAEVERFLLYDLYRDDGTVDENVFAYSNGAGEERALVLYHNRFAATRGWVRVSAAMAVAPADGGSRLERRTLAEGLAVTAEPGRFLLFRDLVSGLELVRECRALAATGLYAELGGYGLQVFLDFREVVDDDEGTWSLITDALAGAGVPSLDEARRELVFAPVLAPFRKLVCADRLRDLLAAAVQEPSRAVDPSLLDAVEDDFRELLEAAGELAGGADDEAGIAEQLRARLTAVLSLPVLVQRLTDDDDAAGSHLSELLPRIESGAPGLVGALLGWLLIHALGHVADQDRAGDLSWIDEWLLGTALADALGGLGLDEAAADRSVVAVKLMISTDYWWRGDAPVREMAHGLLARILTDDELSRYIGVNRHAGVLWFHKESFEEMLVRLLAAAVVGIECAEGVAVGNEMRRATAVVRTLDEARKSSQYRVELLVEALQGPAIDPGATR